MSDQGIPDLGRQLAQYERRIYELERKLRLLEEPEAAPTCCWSYCKFKSGSSTLTAGGVGDLDVTVKREQRARIFVWGTASALLDADGDLFFGGRIAIGGTFYDPRITWRNQVAKAGDRANVAPICALDVAAGADMTVRLEVQNHDGGTLTWKSAALLVHVFYTRQGSLSCAPPIGGTGV